MQTIHAVFENGVFRPTEPINLPEGTEVVVSAPSMRNGAASHQTEDDDLDAIYAVLGRRYRSGHRDTAERHNEHQP